MTAKGLTTHLLLASEIVSCQQSKTKLHWHVVAVRVGAWSTYVLLSCISGVLLVLLLAVLCM